MRPLIFSFLATLVLFTPAVSYALDPIVQCGWGGTPCTACDFFALAGNAIRWLVALITLVITLVVVWAGIKIATSGGDSHAVSDAKHMLTNALIGFAILLSAWLVVDTLMKITKFGEGSPLGPWNTINVNACKTAGGTTIPGPTPGGPSPSPNPSGGQCSEQPLGSCNASVLGPTFGSVTNQAIGICRIESGGNPAAKSGTDKTADRKHSVSVGLFQINLTNHTISCNGDTLDCPSAFTAQFTSEDVKGNNDVYIKNMALYNRCVAAAQNVTCNVQEAWKTYTGQGKNSWRPWGANSKCKY